MAVRPIDANELYRIEKLLDTDIVRQDKVALNLLEQVLYDIQHVPALTQPNEPLISGFDVIDTKTGEYPDLWEIALKEDWANGLMYCDMEGFAIEISIHTTLAGGDSKNGREIHPFSIPIKA